MHQLVLTTISTFLEGYPSMSAFVWAVSFNSRPSSPFWKISPYGRVLTTSNMNCVHTLCPYIVSVLPYERLIVGLLL